MTARISFLSVRVCSVLLAGLWLSACGDGDHLPQFGRDAEAVITPDQPGDDELPPDEPDETPPTKPDPVELPPDEEPVDAGAPADSADAATRDDAASEDAARAATDASDAAAEFDAGTALDDAGFDADLALDAGNPADAGFDSGLAEDTGTADTGPTPDTSACPDGAARDACGVCGGDAGSCHPLFGRYAARTQLYARQRSSLKLDEQAAAIDVVSKGVLLSVVDIDGQGRAKEHYCLLELGGKIVIEEQEAEIASWLKPSASQKIADTTVPLELSAGRYVRALSAHKAYYGWQPGTCTSASGLPANASDCRVQDTDGDKDPGGAMFLGLSKPADPETGASVVQLNVAAQLGFGWSIPAGAGPDYDGNLSGGFQLVELSRSGDFADLLDKVQNSACPDDSGHIELVRNDAVTCDEIITGRRADPTSAGMFDVTLDKPAPQASACVEATCALDSDKDGTPDCNDGCPQDAAKTAGGACGCGNPETDGDGDGVPNCVDLCPQDHGKNKPLVCGCGVADTNSDSDSALDCNDLCPNDGNKTAAGICGCGISDANSDNDSLVDCKDGCPTNGAKTAPGTCGCATADTDSDKDGVPNCNDACVDDPQKTTTGLCGCGVAETDSDGDKEPNCTDGCPNDGKKTAPLACGCGNAETNSDSDSTPDCKDQCPSDGAKVAPGVCGCGNAETNSDDDAVPDCKDECPHDGKKTAPLVCGCGALETNSDSDSTPDCHDECPADGSKTKPGVCGCGVADVDLNGDNTIDCSDSCPNDPAKVAPGLCGCGIADTNADKDSQPACHEECDNDPNKVARGQCGCGVADTDSDGDKVANCNDQCPNDASKTTLGLCGCNVADTDSDGDKVPNCTDGCPNDGNKTVGGVCGCGVADIDSDGDKILNCNDGCPNDANKTAGGVCGCGVADTDTDKDTVPDCRDECDNNPNLTVAGPCGCDACPTNPLVGTYAVRSSVYSKQRNGKSLEQTKAINFSLITITQRSDGKLELTDRQCWNQTIPNGGTGAYSWSKPAWVQAMPAAVRVLTPNSNGTYTRPAVPTRYGWDPARQPSACSSSSTPMQPWLSAWGSTCLCNTPGDALPPYDKSASGYDCRAVDSDGDGQPGISGVAGLSEPGVGAEANNGLAVAYAAGSTIDSWVITVGSNGLHTATVDDKSVAQVIGCSGAGCIGLPNSAPPPGVTCPPSSNRAFFIPVSGNDATCNAILSKRATLFAQSADAPWPDDTTCPPPP